MCRRRAWDEERVRLTFTDEAEPMERPARNINNEHSETFDKSRWDAPPACRCINSIPHSCRCSLVPTALAASTASGKGRGLDGGVVKVEHLVYIT